MSKKSMSKKTKSAEKAKQEAVKLAMGALSPEPKLIRDYGTFLHVEIGDVGFVSFNGITENGIWFLFQNGMRSIMGSVAFERANRVFPIDVLAKHVTAFSSFIVDTHGMDPDAAPFAEFFALINERATKIREAIAERQGRGVVEATDLPILYPKGTHVVYLGGNDPIGGIVENVRFSSGFFGDYWLFRLRVLIDRRGAVEDVVRTISVPGWKGLIPVDDCPIKPLGTGELYETLTQRGRVFRDLSQKAVYVRCTGQLERPRYMRMETFRADGRVMIDPASFELMDSDGMESQIDDIHISNDDSRFGGQPARVQAVEIGDADLWRCHSHVFGFSFRAKQWGRMRVAEIEPIAYRGDAFDRLVMEDNTKTMVRALVQNSGTSFSDVIDGKGGGCIFLLEGEPGLGKTLTAETVAEDLRRPLYSISVGELGTDPDTLEQRLRMILDIATRWNAVLLLDEADIFLEERDTHSIARNAMVGVLLRLLEYHEGVLFLTTNRCQNIDRAFLSRISIALSFPKADVQKRGLIWRNLLQAAGMDHLADYYERLAELEINGRQIKNAIRIAQTLALSEKRQVTYDDLRRPIEVNAQFATRLQAKRDEGHKGPHRIAA